jgi:hypothetical protein
MRRIPTGLWLLILLAMSILLCLWAATTKAGL